MKRLLVTGGSGFIGSALVRSLVAQGHGVLNVDLQTYAALPGALDEVDGEPTYQHLAADIADFSVMSEAFREFDPHVVVNLAAESHVDRSIDNAWPFMTTNILGVANLLTVATSHWAEGGRDPEFRFVHVSTDEVFGSIPFGSFAAESQYRPRSPYSASKAAGDHLVRAWFHTYGLPTIVTNSSNNYGPFQHPEKLIPMMIIRSAESLSLPIYGNGFQERDWIHVDDHVRGLLAAYELGDPGETYLFGTGETHTNLFVAKSICRLVDSQLSRPPRTGEQSIEFVEDRPGHDFRYCIDPTESTRKLGWRAAESFEVGLAGTVDWYCDNSSWWRSLIDSDAISRKGRAR